MRTRNILAGLSALAMMAFATGCNDDLRPDINQGGNGENGEGGPGVYMGVNFSMPASNGGTRSVTDGDNSSSDGVEIGSTIENNVNEVFLVLARKADNGFIASSVISKNNLTVTSDFSAQDKVYRGTAKFELNNLEEFYKNIGVDDKSGDNCQVNVFVFCNATSEIMDAVAASKFGENDWTNTVGSVNVSGQDTEGSIWSSTNGGSFLMSNVSIATREIPGKFDNWTNYTTVDKAFHLSDNNQGSDAIDNKTNRGPIKVHRTAARIDFRDGSAAKDQTYDVMYTKNLDGSDDQLVISVKLNKMALVNMGKAFYFLQRVSTDGMDANSTLCGYETPSNYVVGPNASDFMTALGNKFADFKFADYYNYPFFNENGEIDNSSMAEADRWGTVVIKDLLDGTLKDEWTGNPTGSHDKGQYNVWRYLTPNLIPGTDTDYQQNAISTGVVFKGKMIGNTDAKFPEITAGSSHVPYEGYDPYVNERQVIKVLNDTEESTGSQVTAPILYQHDGRMYYTFKNVYDAAIAASFSYTYNDKNQVIPSWNRSNSLYKAVFGEGGTGFKFMVDGKEAYADGLEIDPNSAYAAYMQWKNLDGTIKDATKEDAFKAIATNPEKANFTIYQRSYDATDGWGYYCYYYHWIRHNDNGKNGIMGPMEFQVVRNNVYKLAVTAIKRLGHPRISKNDPDKPKPDTPDESTKIYMTVDAEVVPWVVRLNDIVFE